MLYFTFKNIVIFTPSNITEMTRREKEQKILRKDNVAIDY